MKRGEPMKRKTPMQRSAMRRKHKDTGPLAKTKQEVWARAGHACERCGAHLDPDRMNFSIHHRKPRQSGGTDDERINELSNLLLLCGSGTTGCHGYVESHRAEAYEHGWLVHSWDDPEGVPIVRRGRDSE